MEGQALLRMAEDPAVSDDRVFAALCERLSDKNDAEGRHIPPTAAELAENESMRDALLRLRPGVMQKLLELVIEGHRYCCGPEAQGA